MPTEHARHTTILHWLPNGLTVLRGILGIIIVVCTAHEFWTVGFWLMIVALLTDFLDGLAAKKLHAKTKLGAALDPIADCLLSAGGMVGLALAGHAPWGLIVAMAVSAGLIGYVKFLRPDRPRVQHAVQSCSVIYLFVVWTIIIWNLATLAFGWSWLYPVITIVLIVGAASLKRHRLKAWYGWLHRAS